jgi:hypothetical protein
MEERKKIGGRLIYFAWGVEGVAATIGLILAGFVILNTRTQILSIGGNEDPSLYLSMFLGGLPFIVVALVELTKIPLAHAAYLSKGLAWKLVFTVGLTLLMVITFETLLNGFERNFTQRTFPIKKLRNDLQFVSEQFDAKGREIEVLRQTTDEAIRQQYLQDMRQLETETTQARDQISKELQDAEYQYSGDEGRRKQNRLKSLEAESQRLDERHEARLVEIDERYQREIKGMSSSVSERRKTLQDQINALEKRLDSSRKAELSDLSKVKDRAGIDELLGRELNRITDNFQKRIDAAPIRAKESLTRNESQIQALKDELLEVRQEIEVQNEREAFTPRGDIEKRYQKRIDGITDQIKDLRAENGKVSADREIANLSAERNSTIEAARERLLHQGEAGAREREEIRKRFARQRAPDAELLAKYRNGIAQLSTKGAREDTTRKRDDQVKAENSAYKRERDKLTKDRDALSKEIAIGLTESRVKLQPIRKRLLERQEESTKRFELRSREVEKRHESNLAKLEDKQGRIEELQRERVALSERKVNFRDDISRLAQASQIYRVAQFWFEKENPADIEPGELKWVAFLWFGSLAAITAWTGTLLAFGGIVLKHGAPDLSRSASASLLRSMRRLVVDYRRRIREPKIKEVLVEKEIIKEVEKEVIIEKPVVQEVIKEVPVDKVVFKEIPKEIIQKVMVYVPVPTDEIVNINQVSKLVPAEDTKD